MDSLNDECDSIRSDFQAGVDTLYNKCVSCGSTPSSKTPTAISNSIQSIYTNRYNAGVSATKKGNATVGNVLSGKTFTSTAGVNLTGTMPNRGTLNWSASNTTKTVSAGYYSGGTLDSRPSYTAGYNAGRTQGQNDVKNNPNKYGLYNKTQYDNHYNEGYNAGKAAGQSSIAGSYQLDFRVNAHDENVNTWIRYRDWITLDIKSNGTASLGDHSFMNAQIRSEQGEYCKISKV